METYRYWYHCQNCGQMYYIDIPKGTKIREVLSEEKCPYCGCFTLY